MNLSARPFDTAKLLPAGPLRSAFRVAQPLVESALGFAALWRIYAACPPGAAAGPAFASLLLERLGVRWTFDVAEQAALAALPGPLVIAANHPHGGLDALVMMQILEAARPGTWRLLANRVICDVPEFTDWLIPVDPLGQGSATRARNAAGLQQATRWLATGGALGLFPAGRVSHFDRRLGAVCDQPWRDHAGRLAAASGASLAVLHFSGSNSRLFLAVPRRWSRLRALLLARELARPKTRNLEMRLGALYTPAEARRLTLGPRAGARLRAMSFLAADRRLPAVPETAGALPPVAASAAVLPPTDPAHLLLRSPDGATELACFRGDEAPALLEEIGRARELTFRAAGQGVGRERDLAPEDSYYHHLVVRTRESGAILGAYRLGLTQEILATRGPEGLYLGHVFDIRPGFYARLGPAIELSRSFILPEHQRDNRTLGLLWRGLGLVAHREGCNTLFGSVTISNQHQPLTRAVLVEQLQRHYADTPELSRLVRARRPFVPLTSYHPLAAEAWVGEPIDALAPIIARIERGERGIPPLLRYYCALGARFLAYHVEAEFQDALYCLLRVELSRIPAGYRRRFLDDSG